jgi:hypothetical protein
MTRRLELAAAIFAIVAAVFWFVSAAQKLPPMLAYFGATPTTAPFYASLRFTVAMNRWAALFDGFISSLCGRRSVGCVNKVPTGRRLSETVAPAAKLY